MKRHVKTLNEYMHSEDDEMVRNLSCVGIPNISDGLLVLLSRPRENVV